MRGDQQGIVLLADDAGGPAHGSVQALVAHPPVPDVEPEPFQGRSVARKPEVVFFAGAYFSGCPDQLLKAMVLPNCTVAIALAVDQGVGDGGQGRCREALFC